VKRSPGEPYTVSNRCPLCKLRVSGVADDEETAVSRFENNMRLHREGRRCAMRQHRLWLIPPNIILGQE
jgi:hypothetical protein